MSEWISVKDKLPEINQIVIACRPSGYDGAPVYSWAALLDDSDGWMWGCQSSYTSDLLPLQSADWNSITVDDDYQISHWQPLPAPPQ